MAAPRHSRSENEDAILTRLLEQWLESAERGAPLAAEQLCRGRPHLLPALRELIGLAGPGAAPAEERRAASTMPATSTQGLAGARAAAGDDHLLGQRLLGRYELVARLGAGAMGLVYVARDAVLERPVAVKILDDLFAARPDRVQRFRSEARALAALDDPHVVAVHDFDLDGRPPYLVMDLVRGVDLARWLQALRGGRAREPRPWPPPPGAAAAPFATLASVPRQELDALFERPWPALVAYVVQQAAQGLAAAHRSGVVHRDVKPSNLVLGPDGRLRVLDFGLARRELDGGLTRSTESVGTPRYMAPEQVRGETADPRTDVYGLGATLYELLTARPAFDGAGRALESAILHDDPLPPRRLLSRLPRDLEAVCLEALQKRRERRYADAAAMAADLERFLCFEPVAARARVWPAPARRALGAWRRHRPSPAVAATALLLAGGAVALVAGRLGEYRAEATIAERDAAAELLARLPPTLGLAGTAAERHADPQTAQHRAALDRVLELDPGNLEARFLRRCLALDAALANGGGPEARETQDGAVMRGVLGDAAFARLEEAYVLLRERAAHPEGAAAAAARACELLQEPFVVATGAQARLAPLRDRLLLGALLQTRSRWREAQQLARRMALEHGPSATSAWGEAIAAHALGRSAAELVERFAAVHELAPGDPSVCNTLARLHLELGHVDRARAAIRQVVAQTNAPAHANHWNLYVEVLRAAAELDEAARIAEQRLPSGRREIALARIERSRALADPGARDAHLAAALAHLARVPADAPAAVKATAAAERARARTLQHANARVRALQLLDELRSDPGTPLLRAALRHALAALDDEARRDPRLLRGLTDLLLADRLREQPGDLDAARALADLRATNEPVAALEVLRRHLAPAALTPADRERLARLLAALEPGARASWQRRLELAGLLPRRG